MADSNKPLAEEENIPKNSHNDDRNDSILTQPSNSRPTTLNTGGQKDMYWFAHAADPPHEKPKRNVNHSSSVDQDDNALKRSDGENESPTDGASSRVRGATQFESKEDASPQAHKDREERMRQFKERLMEDRSRRLQELELASVHAQKIREHQEEERRRKIEDLRIKDIERRQAVEERKRQIWEAEHERKEAILRRNMEREAKIEARRNAQRNSMSFAFGSSTPRTIDLEPGYVHYYRTAGNVMVNGRSSEEREIDYYKKRPPSADNLDSRQDKSLSPREFDDLTIDTNSFSLEADREHVKQHYRRSFAGMNSDETKACLTMTDNSFDSPLWASKQMPELGFFSQSGLVVGEDLMTRSMVSLSTSASRGRRRTDITPTILPHRDLSLRSDSPGNQTKRAVSMSRLDLLSQPRRRTIDASATTAAPNSSMSKSMFNLANNTRRVKRGVVRNGDVMSQSMVHLTGSPPVPPPRSPTRTKRHLTSPLSHSTKQLSKSMVHLTPPPRPNRATQLRALAAARKEGQASEPVTGAHGTLATTGSAKEVNHSPARPRSSMSLASEKSATSSHYSTVSMRVRSAPRRTRPVSIAGTIPDTFTPPQPPPRQSRTSERKAPASAPPVRPSRAKSAGTTSDTESNSQNKPPAVPKPAAAVAKSVSDKEAVNADQQSQAEAPAAVEDQQQGSPTNKPRITSEEAAKAALAEKRRLAREQAEREAELERQRQEQLKKEEEEKRRQEEEEQRRLEEEHSKLVEALRLQEEEKLRKAIEDQQKVEEEQKLQREEEAKLKAEREEQERKAKEEAEKQRKELEEKLIKEEAERAERKKRVEQIMKRTRGKTVNQNGNDSQEKSDSGGDGETGTNAEESAIKMNGTADVNASESLVPPPEAYGSSDETVNSKNDHNALLDNAPFVRPSLGDVIAETDPFGSLSAPQTNGYAAQEIQVKHNINTDEKINPLVGNLLDFDPLSSAPNEKMSTSPDFNGLVDFGSAANTTTNQNNIFLNNSDNVNSNRTTAANPFISFEENANVKQETTVADLLS